MKSQDKIEKQVVIQAPVSRVWRALTDVEEFEKWFGVKLDSGFKIGETITGTFEAIDEAALIDYQKQLGVTPSAVQSPTPHTVFCTVENMEPETYFSFRWIPYGIDADADPQNEPTTLVEFKLVDVSGDTQLTIIESGFNKVPEHRRLRAFLMNSDGWEQQAQRIKEYVER